MKVSAPAEVRLNTERLAHVSPLVQGQLLEINAVLGDRVERGQPLVLLRSIALGDARAELLQANAMSYLTRVRRDRQAKLRKSGATSERAVVEAEADLRKAAAQRDAALAKLEVFGIKGGKGPDMSLLSPIDGLILEKHATRGEIVDPSDSLFVVGDLDRIWVIGHVYERDISELARGMSARLELEAYPGRSWEGVVGYISNTLDATSRTLEVRVELDNPDGLLRPGLSGQLTLRITDEGSKRWVVPRAAVQTLEGEALVFVSDESGIVFTPTLVRAGRRDAKHIEILEGLKGGERVVTSGAFTLKSELMKGALGHGHAH